MDVTVYTKPSCPQCDGTKRALKLRGIEFDEGDALEQGNLDAIHALGFSSAPVVVVLPDGATLGQEVAWAGYRPDMIDQHFGPAPRRA